MADDKKPVLQTDDLTAKIASSVAAAVAEATVKVQERIAPIESRTPSLFSVYNPDGRKVRPKLRTRIIFAGGELREDTLTNDEIELVNKVRKPGRYHGGQWAVRIRKDDSDVETVFIDFPSRSVDQRMVLPNSFTGIVQEILKEQDAAPA